MNAPSAFPLSRWPSDNELDLKRDLLQIVLGRTLKKNGVPAAWVGGEINTMKTISGELRIEVRLSLRVDEPRFLTFLSSFQADFERRLLAVAPDAKQWLSGITWSVTPDATFETAMPSPEYWEIVITERELTSRQKGAMGWDRDALERHFVDTNPGEVVVDFADTVPPERGVENLAPPPKR